MQHLGGKVQRREQPSGEALALIQMSVFSRSGYLHAISSPILAPSLNPSRWTEERCKWLSRAITSSAISSVENPWSAVWTDSRERPCPPAVPSESPENRAETCAEMDKRCKGLAVSMQDKERCAAAVLFIVDFCAGGGEIAGMFSS